MKKVLSIPLKFFSFLAARALCMLTNPVNLYGPGEVTNLKALKARLKVGDVLLI